MKIAVATASEPFRQTRQLSLAQQLVEALERLGQQSQLIKLPIDLSNGDAYMQSLLALRLLRLRNVDRLVAVDYPACSVQHGDKRAWLFKEHDEDIAAFRGAHEQGEAALEGELNTKHLAADLPGICQSEALSDLLERTFASYMLECSHLVVSIPQDKKKIASSAQVLKVPHLDIQLGGESDRALTKEDWERIAQFLAKAD